MADFINTIDTLGDDIVADSIIDGSITEFRDDVVTSVGNYAFYKCDKLEVVELPNVVSLGQIVFYSCAALKVVSLPKLASIAYNTTNNGAFKGCKSLETISLPGIVKLDDAATFYGCSALKDVDLPNFETGGREHQYVGCTSLRILRLPKFRGTIGQLWFQNCSALIALVLGSEAICSLGTTNAFTNSPIASGTGYIYVPRALVDTYKAATNWSTYASQFRVLEDYTVDGTTTRTM